MIIDKIEKNLPALKQAVQNFSPAQHEGTFGEEGAYTPKGLKTAMEDVVRLVEQAVLNQSVFMQEFSHQERVDCHNMVNGFSNSVAPGQFAPQIDGNKALISKLRLVFGNQARASLLKEASVISQNVTEAKFLMEELSKEKGRLDKLRQTVEKFCEQSRANDAKIQALAESARNAEGSIKQSRDVASSTNKQIAAILQAVKKSQQSVDGMKDAVEGFFKEIGGRAQELAQQKTQTEEYEAKLKEYAKKQAGILESAMEALGAATAGGLTQAFTARVEEEQKRKRWGWLAGAGVCLVLAGLSAFELHTGIIFGAEAGDASISDVLAKIAISGIFFVGTWFCASQHNKLSNVLEDYKYKQVLAQSMSAFIKNLSGNDAGMQAYLVKLFEQMFQDPLRKGHDVSTPMTDLVKNILRSAKKGDGPDNPSGKG